MTITIREVAEKAVELATDFPGFVYQPPTVNDGAVSRSIGCRYVHTTESGEKVGGCLFGQALIALGVPAETLEGYELTSIAGVLSMMPEVDTTSSSREMRLALSHTQGEQDHGSSWGEAVGPLREVLAREMATV